MNRFEKRKLAIDKTILEQIDGYKGVYARAEEEDRDPSDEERLEIESHLKAIETLKVEKEGVEAQLKTLAAVEEEQRRLGPTVSHISNVQVGSEPVDRMFQGLNNHMFQAAQKTIGEQFVSSKGYARAKEALDQGGLPEGFSTGLVQLDTKGTLLEGSSSPGSGTGGAFLPVPQVIPGVTTTLFQQLTVASLVLDGVASGNTVRYVVEGTATSGAAGVAEAGAKPESLLNLSTKDEPIKKIATLLPVSDEMLEDAPAVQAYINGRLMLFIQIEEERQLCRGTSGGNEVQGFLTSRSVPVYTGGTADNKAVQMFKAMNSMRASAFLEPEWSIVHPTDWQIIRLLTDTAGQFFGGGPFQGPYGNGANLSQSGQAGGPTDMLWGKPCYVTAAIGNSGTALIGTRANAQVWRRGGISVEAANQHSTYFANNLVAIRAEERLGLAVYRSGGYVEARLAAGPGG